MWRLVMQMVVIAIRIDEAHLKSGLPSKGKKGVEKVAILAAETLLIMSLPTPIPSAQMYQNCQ